MLIAGCSSLEITSPSPTAPVQNSNDLNLDVKVYFGPENPEPATVIDFTVPSAGWVRLEVLNATGYRVKLVFDEMIDAGMAFRINFDGKNDRGQSIESGIYFYRLQWENQVSLKAAVICRSVTECEEMINHD